MTLASPRTQRLLAPVLPSVVRTALSEAINLPLAHIDLIWSALGETALAANSCDVVVQEASIDEVLSVIARQSEIGCEVLVPPVSTCRNVGCKQHGKPLGGNRKSYSVHMYTLRRGVLPAQVYTLYCRECRTTYRPNYFVINADSPHAIREYYEGLPEWLEVSEHSYVDREFMNLVRAQMAFSHSSGETISRVYNAGLTRHSTPHPITPDDVWNAFYLHALLLDAQRRGEQMFIPHQGEHSERFTAALWVRNLRMAGTGQPQWAHACDDCQKIIASERPVEPRRRLTACVMDGVTLGHPRCAMDHCLARLDSPRDRFCASHRAQEQICAIVGCERPCVPHGRTCDVPAHRDLELSKRTHGNAMKRLKRRHQSHQSTGHGRGRAPPVPDLDVLDDPEIAPTLDDDVSGQATESQVPAGTTEAEPTEAHVPEEGDRSVPPPKMKSRLTRRWTHNEQLVVRCCGTVIARASFYEAESPSNCLALLRRVFPLLFPGAQPSFCFFDSNCLLLKHMLAVDDHSFPRTGFPVDVFHATVKHKDSDAFCAMNCNPATFPELIDGDKWVFNSSACEQINVWFGKFQSIVREMSEVHYNFYLDEMILIYNEWRQSVLAREGKKPHLVPVEELQIPHV